jgi:hypothetical protein
MTRLLETIRRWLAVLLLPGGAAELSDNYDPNGYVEAVLRYAHGPKKGQIYKVYEGKNVVTNFINDLNGAAPTSGRDLMRRILVPDSFTGSLANDSGSLTNTGAIIKSIELGDGTTAEAASDETLVSAISGSIKDVSAVEFHPTSTYVTFIVEYDETEVNQTISEAALLSGRSPRDFVARKTFGAFPKTNEFTLQIRWTIRF